MNIKNKYYRMFFAPEGTAVSTLGPVGGDEPDPNDGADDVTPQEETQEVPEGEEQPEAETPAAGAAPSQFTMDSNTLAAALKAAGLGAPQPAAQPEKKPLTPEQIAEYQKQLNFWNPDKAFLEEFGNLETQSQAFQKMRDGLSNQFMTMMQAWSQDREAQLQQQFAPALTFIQNYESQQQLGRFAGAYKELADPNLKPIFDAAVSGLHQSGKRFANEAEMFKGVAAAMTGIIQKVNPNFKLSPGSNPGKNPNAIKPAPRGGAGGGGGKSNGTESGRPLAVSMLPPVR